MKKIKIDNFDINYWLIYVTLFFASIFLITSFIIYFDEGITFLVIVFGLGAISFLRYTLYFYLSYSYFRHSTLTLFSEIKNETVLKGAIILQKNIQTTTKIMVILKNTHKINVIDDEGKKYKKTESIWEIENKGSVEKKDKNSIIHFSFPLKQFHKGRLVLEVKAKLKMLTLKREYLLKEHKNR